MSLTAALLGLAIVAAQPTEENVDKKYTIDFTETTKDVEKGKRGLFAMHIKAAEGYKVSQDAPLKIQLASSGLDLQKKTLKSKDATEKKWTSPRFAVRFGADEPGEQKIDVDAVFFVCDEKICERKKEKMTVAVKVQE